MKKNASKRCIESFRLWALLLLLFRFHLYYVHLLVGDSISTHCPLRYFAATAVVVVVVVAAAAFCLVWFGLVWFDCSLRFILCVRCCCFVYDACALCLACSICFEQFVWGKWISHGIYFITTWVYAAAAVAIASLSIIPSVLLPLYIFALLSHSKLWRYYWFLYCFSILYWESLLLFLLLRCCCCCCRYLTAILLSLPSSLFFLLRRFFHSTTTMTTTITKWAVKTTFNWNSLNKCKILSSLYFHFHRLLCVIMYIVCVCVCVFVYFRVMCSVPLFVVISFVLSFVGAVAASVRVFFGWFLGQ